MKVIVQGEEFDYHDDEGLRSACSSHAIQLVSLVKGKQLRTQLSRFYSDIYLIYIKAAGVMAFHQFKGQKQIDIELFGELVEFLRAAVGEGPPRMTPIEPPKKEIIVP